MAPLSLKIASAHAAVAVAIALSWSAPAAAVPTDLEVKAAFLPRFARYVTWPPAAMPRGSDPFVLCVIGGDPFGATIDQAARSQRIDGRPVVVRRMNSATGADGCQITFVQGNHTAQVLAALGRRPVLTVTDAANGGQRGIIHFVTVGGRVRFFIDESEAARHRLSISSRLLALAVGVKQR